MKPLALFAAFGSLLLPAALSAATVTGTVVFASKRGQSPTPAETLVWLEPVGQKLSSHRPAATFQMLTRGKSITPHVLAIPLGSTVEFPNDDPISHNLFSLSTGNGFDLGLYRKGTGKAHRFEAPGIVNVYCNVHPNMSAVIHVMPTPYYAFADSRGTFRLSDVPAGRYRLVAWNELGVAESTLDFGASASSNVPLTIDSRSFRAQSHTNKDGKAYQAPATRDY
jgi:plastocyanin